MNQKVKYEVLNVGELPEQVQSEILTNSESNGFFIHNDKKYTYIFYKANYTENEYISTNLSAKRKNGEYIVTSLVDWASNDGSVSYEKVIKLERVSEDDIVLKEKDKR